MSSNDGSLPDTRNSIQPSLLLDPDTKRLLELTSEAEDRSPDTLEEIVALVQKKAPKLLDGLTESNKQQIARACRTRLYAFDEVVFNQGAEPDAYYTVIRGAVSIYALNSSSASRESDQQGRGKYGVFITQLPPGESFGELSFNGDGDHSRRNAGVISDGCHGEARIVGNQSTLSAPTEVEASDVCVLYLIPEHCYMSEMYARHSAKHQTKDKINLLKGSPLFKHWTMDQLVKMAYAMKKKSFEKGATIIQQGERMEHLWLVKSGQVRISHTVTPPNSIDARGYLSNSRAKSLTVDISDLGARDVIGLVESLEESVKKSQRDVVALAGTEMFFVQLSFFKQLLAQDACTLSLVEKVAEQRIKWMMLRKDYASKFTNMSMKLPKDAAAMSNFSSLDGSVSIPTKAPRKTRTTKVEPSGDVAESRAGRRRRKVDGLMRQNRRTTIDLLANEAGLSKAF